MHERMIRRTLAYFLDGTYTWTNVLELNHHALRISNKLKALKKIFICNDSD